MRRALVTGATGFIGAHLVRRLLAEGYDVHALCRPAASAKRLAGVRARLSIHRVSLTAGGTLRRVVERVAPHCVLHLAAATMHGGVGRPAAEVARTAILGTANLVDACAGVDYACFVNTGDAFEYGPAAGALREARPCRPTTLDGVAKLAATRYAQAAACAGGRPLVTLRLFSIYGPGDHARRLVPQVVARAAAGRPLRLSQPDIGRDLLYIDDLIELYLAVITSGARAAGGVINAGSGQLTTIGELVDHVCRLTGSRSARHWGAYPTAAHDRERYVADVALASTLFGWRPRTSLVDGLAATIHSLSRQR